MTLKKVNDPVVHCCWPRRQRGMSLSRLTARHGIWIRASDKKVGVLCNLSRHSIKRCTCTFTGASYEFVVESVVICIRQSVLLRLAYQHLLLIMFV